MTESRARLPAESITVLLGVATLVSGVATGLFSDLRLAGQIIGLVAFAAWVAAIGLILWGSRALARWTSAGAFVLTAVLLAYAFITGPRLSSRTLVLAPNGLAAVRIACPSAAQEPQVTARIALNQLEGQFVHIELAAPACDGDVRIRSEDLRAVLPAP